MNPNWEIKVDHINVNQGDSTLIRVYDTGKPEGEKLQKAVLIDGGIPGVRKRIETFLEAALCIEKSPAGNKYKNLDAIVVTHFDNDHIGGIVGILNDLAECAQNPTWRPSPDPRNFFDTRKPTIVYDPGYMESSKKRKRDKAVSITKEDTLKNYYTYTGYLNFPAVTKINLAVFPNGLKPIPSDADINKLSDVILYKDSSSWKMALLDTTKRKYNDYDCFNNKQCYPLRSNNSPEIENKTKEIFQKIDDILNKIDTEAAVTDDVKKNLTELLFQYTNDGRNIDARNTYRTVKSYFCRVSDGLSYPQRSATLIGLDILWNTMGTLADTAIARYSPLLSLQLGAKPLREGKIISSNGSRPYDYSFSLNDLRDYNYNTECKDKPALFVVAANGRRTLKPKEKVDWGELPDATNSRGIALILMSPNNRILHYLAGDLEKEKEYSILTWLEENLPKSTGKKDSIPVMKLSHHGSKGSTPPQLIADCNPSHVIISAGINAKYKHPSIELLLYLVARNDSLSKASNKLPLHIFATNYPYYLDLSGIQYFLNVMSYIDFPRKDGDLNYRDYAFANYRNGFDNVMDEALTIAIPYGTLRINNDGAQKELKRLKNKEKQIQKTDLSDKKNKEELDEVQRKIKDKEAKIEDYKNQKVPLEGKIKTYLPRFKEHWEKLCQGQPQEANIDNNSFLVTNNEVLPSYNQCVAVLYSIKTIDSTSTTQKQDDVKTYTTAVNVTKRHKMPLLYPLPPTPMPTPLNRSVVLMGLSDFKAEGNDSFCTIGTDPSNGTTSDIQLASGDLYNLINMLPEKCITLKNSVKNSNDKKQVTIIGIVTNNLEKRFERIGIQTVQMKIQGAIQDDNGKKWKISVSDTEFCDAILQLSPTNLSAIKLSPAKIQADNTLIFKIGGNEIVQRTITECMSYINFDSYGLLLNILISALKANDTLVLDQNRTKIIFDLNYGCVTRFELIGKIGDISIPFLIFSDTSITFAASKTIDISSEIEPPNEFWAALDTTLKWETGDIKFMPALNTRVLLRYDGTGWLSFVPVPEQDKDKKPENIVKSFLKQVFKDNTFMEGLTKFNLGSIVNIKQVNVEFDLAGKKTPAIQIINQFTFLNFKDDPLITSFLFPNFTIAGYMDSQIGTARNNNLDEKTDNSDEDDLDQDINITGIKFKDLLAKGDISSPIGLENYQLANFSFFADPRIGNYTVSAKVVNTTNTSWPSEYFAFKGIQLEFFKTVTSYGSSLSSILALGTDEKIMVFVEGTYNKDKETASQWEFSSYISQIQFKDIITLFVSSDQIPEAFPDIDLSNINLMFDIAGEERSFSFDGDLSISALNYEVKFNISANSSNNCKIITAKWDKQGKYNVSDVVKPFLPDPENFSNFLPDIELSFDDANFTYDATQKIFKFNLVISQTKATVFIFPKDSKFHMLFNFRYLLPDIGANLPVVGQVAMPLKAFHFQYSSVQSPAITDPDITQASTSIQKGGRAFFEMDNNFWKDALPPLVMPTSGEQNPQAPAASPDTNAGTPTTYLTPSSPPHWIKIQKTLGPLNLDRLGFSYEEQRIWLWFDAGIKLGGLDVQLQGLGAGFRIDKLDFPDFKLNGLGLGFTGGPITIAGDFLKETPREKEKEHFGGGAVLKMAGLNLSAIGSYIKLDDDTCSVFVFTQLDKPLGGPPCFYVTGLSGGFGYNQRMRIPPQDQVVNFPLLKGLSNPNDLIQVQRTLEDENWLQTAPGEDWLVVGVNFTSFQLVQTNALMVVEFGQDFQISVLGRSTMTLPKVPAATTGSIVNADTSDNKMAYVEMGFEATYNPNKGVLCITALLSPNSYVLTKDCHLSGGFAFYSWFKDQKNDKDEHGNFAQAGDFVVTLGGYHPSFHAPVWYPRVPRLAFNWQVDSNVNINGEAYFALTPSAVMAGGMLNAEYHSGDLKAWLKTWADFLIEWHPYHYEAEIGISVGASYKLNLLFTSVTLSIEIGADLRLWGPPTGGEVHVDWTIISFTIPFGERRTTKSQMTWSEFCHLLPKPKEAADAKPTLNCIMADGGLMRTVKDNSADKDAVATWIVRPDQFSFYTESAIPINQIKVNSDDPKKNGFTIVKDKQDTAAPQSYIKPMRRKKDKTNDFAEIDHTHSISIVNDDTGEYIDINGSKWNRDIVKRNVPEALWGVPLDEDNGKKLQLDTERLLNDRWIGLKVNTPDPQNKGQESGTIPIKKAFDCATLEHAVLPLTQASQPTSLATPTEFGSDQNVNEITSDTKARDKTAQKLKALGFFSREPSSLSKMQNWANKAAIELQKLPLLRT